MHGYKGSRFGPQVELQVKSGWQEGMKHSFVYKTSYRNPTKSSGELEVKAQHGAHGGHTWSLFHWKGHGKNHAAQFHFPLDPNFLPQP